MAPTTEEFNDDPLPTLPRSLKSSAGSLGSTSASQPLATSITANTFKSIAASCDDILCLCDKRLGFVLLWNPSIRKFKELPPFQNNAIPNKVYMTFKFGYDQVSDIYKVVVLYYIESKLFDTTKVKVHALDTNSWKTTQTFTFGAFCDEQPETFVRGIINWMAYTQWTRNRPLFILSFDLGNDSYQKLLPPTHAKINPDYLRLSVLS
ncbi:F-box/kelch-repeat protein At3g23880-like [Vicia villosa]|uniref:F-box/kelch-repeat protein At3g23880-like n=1 Tax=Vicia villosa TaxID=3911 RepID=UPI00273B849F|nr:F-box/kelch-repeat protein At3g23880-like [Vicia villosa]